MANYNTTEAYDISVFELPESGSAARDIYDIPEEAPARKHRPKSSANARREALSSFLRAVKVFAVSLTLIGLFGAVLISKVNLVLLENEATAVQSDISEAESENTRLIMQLNAQASIDKVDAYAASVLGMSKLERYQIHYFEDRGNDRVIVAGGEEVVEDGANADS